MSILVSNLRLLPYVVAIIETTAITNTIASSVTEQSKSVGGISHAMAASKQVELISKEIGDIADNTEQAAKNAVEASNRVKEVVEAAQKISQKSSEVAENTEKARLQTHREEKPLCVSMSS